ncbi:MAG: Undecaprenyl pyrophosphate synthetase [Candidatus Electronema aureum]|uniref:Isoprenyl transferase n=1 Tax=Candidatus Electronema aureum TaxID=2005002 RepID=A0A521G4V6_9BACT|nr:MAG: Undecaprenyl pyrophosphate synthetase [Candidatus Electronema aureum]
MTVLPVIQPLPVHVAIIMDGNGRWAKDRHQPRLFGHKAGVDSVREIVEAAREIGIRHLTLYAFSTENWQRPGLEVKGLMMLLKTFLQAELDAMKKNGIRLDCFGQKERLPDDARAVLERVIAETADCPGLRLNLALSYGSRTEMLRAVREVGSRCAAGQLRPEEIDEQLFSGCLYSAGQPDPDLLIRTSGEQRLSNFLLWQLSYAELYFTETRWPDFRREQFFEALQIYASRQRRFGKTGEQVEKK